MPALGAKDAPKMGHPVWWRSGELQVVEVVGCTTDIQKCRPLVWVWRVEGELLVFSPDFWWAPLPGHKSFIFNDLRGGVNIPDSSQKSGIVWEFARSKRGSVRGGRV
jgi:hypothetical protein